MDAKITLSFNKSIIEKAKKYAKENNVSLSRLMEFLLDKVTSSSHHSIDKLPVSNWVSQVSEGEVTYVRSSRTRHAMRKEFHGKRKV